LWQTAAKVQIYSIYILGADDSVIERLDLSCVDDADALQQAKQLSSGRGLAQLWQASRFIATLRPTIFDT
jgi:hypothetical protein